MTDEAGWGFREHTYTMNVGSGGNARDGLAVFDDNGKRVGPVVGIVDDIPTPGAKFRGGVWFTLKVGDRTVLLALKEEEDQLFGTQFDGLQFEASNCTGQPVFDTTEINDADLMRIIDAVVGGPTPGQPGDARDNIIYIADPNGTPRIANLGSHPSAGAKSETCTLGASPGIEVINAIPLIDLDAVFTRPFHVQPDVAQ